MLAFCQAKNNMPYERKIRVLTVDDSLFFHRLLQDSLNKINPNIEIIGKAFNAHDALEKIHSLSPDVVTLDVEMPGMSGIELTKVIMNQKPTPIILVSSLNLSVFDALSNGAIDFVQKPDLKNNYTTSAFLSRLASKIVIGSHARLTKKAPIHNSLATERKTEHPNSSKTVPTSTSAHIQPRLKTSLTLNSKIIAIGASTGGTETILEILRQLPTHIPGIVITQHMPAGFTKMYAERLNRICKIEVKEAKNGDVIKPGRALIAPGGLQMKVVKGSSGYSVSCHPGNNVSGHCPSVDVLFSSMAEQVGSNGIGIILTGMGRDGANGMLQMHKAGAYTIGQDKNSCVVYGMPMEAYKLGAVSVQSPCSNIPSVLINYLNTL